MSNNHIIDFEPGTAMAPIVGDRPRYQSVAGHAKYQGRREALRLIYRRIAEAERMFSTEPLTPKQTAMVVRIGLEAYYKGEGYL